MLTVNRAVNAMLVGLTHGEIAQGFTQLWARNFPKHLLEQLGPDVILVQEKAREGDQTAEVGGIQLTSDLEAMVATVQFMIEQSVVLKNVPPQEFRTDAPTESGFAKMVQRLPLLEERKRDIPKWRRNMRGLFRIVSAVWNYELERPEFKANVDPAFARPFTDGCSLMVDFPEPQFPESEREKLERWGIAIGMGLLSRVEAMQKMNPDLDDDAAKVKLLEIAMENQEFAGANILAKLGMLPKVPGVPEQ